MAVSSGIYGLAGVLVGSGITAGGQWVLAARTDRLDARVAKRQVRRELEEIKPRLELATLANPGPRVEWIEYMAMAMHSIETEKWAVHSDRLARQLSDADWDAVEAAYLSFDKVQFAAREVETTGQSEEVRRAAASNLKNRAERALRLTEVALDRLR